jgi:hypothetical protein
LAGHWVEVGVIFLIILPEEWTLNLLWILPLFSHEMLLVGRRAAFFVFAFFLEFGKRAIRLNMGRMGVLWLWGGRGNAVFRVVLEINWFVRVLLYCFVCRVGITSP